MAMPSLNVPGRNPPDSNGVRFLGQLEGMTNRVTAAPARRFACFALAARARGRSQGSWG